MVGEFWRKSLLPRLSCVEDAIQSLDGSGTQIVIVVGPGDIVDGTITDGDIRRGLLRGLTLSSPIESIVHRDPLVVPPELGTETVLQLMRANKIHQLPIVDDERRVVGLHLWDNLQTTAAGVRQMVIMAGGKGVRLRPHTEHCPKPMLLVGDRPILEHIIQRAVAQGFTRFVLAIHYLGHIVEDYFGDGTRWNVRIDYIREQSPLGTGGALSLIEDRPSQPFVVTNGDVMTEVRYSEILDFHERQHAAATMAVRSHEWQHPFGVVHTQGMDIIGFEEKPIHRTHVNAGVYVLEPSTLDVLARGEHCDMPTLFQRLKAKDLRTIVYPMHESWIDVGRPDDLERVRGIHQAA